MRSPGFLIIIVTLMLVVDFYVFQAVKAVSQNLGPKTRTYLFIGYWVISILTLITLLILPLLNLDSQSKGLRSVVFAVLVSLFFAKFTVSIFLLVDDLRRIIQWIAAKIFFFNSEGDSISTGNNISRSIFLSWIGIAAGTSIFGSLIYGFTNKYNYQIKKIPLLFSNLPSAFKGMRIVHISDIHSGSFNNKSAVQKGVDHILQLKPDLILFTGDLVNNKADEMVEYKEVFQKLQAPMGVYSTLGNHDYGDYVQWDSETAKKQNLERLKETHREMGWNLLLNEHVVLEKEGQQIGLLGVENWSNKARFPKYGKLDKAYEGTANLPFKILMSHDPSHWDAEVRKSYQDIDLMLAGHTHGMQFGVELPWFKWSPVQYVYKQWAGLYEEEKQKLYVNRGFGFIGYPGRVGILPEITLLELI